MAKQSKTTRISKVQKTRPSGLFKFSATSARNITLVIIIIAALAVCTTFIASILLKPERLVPPKIEALATNYYENIFYEKMVTSDQFSGDATATLEKHHERGLAIITLRQLLLQDPPITDDEANYLRQYCDENKTTVHFYPDPPYTRTAYHAEFNYACNF